MVRAVIARWLCAAFIAAGLSSPSYACTSRDYAAAYFQTEHGMTLHAWGLDVNGAMQELFLAPSGHWAVITTEPNGCATVDTPQRLWGRLWQPPQTNKAAPLRPMNEGDPT
jgi:hypothetical protein